MTHFWQRHPWMASFVFHALIWGLFYAVARPIYLTNDDVALWWMVSGKLAGWPASEYMVFSHYWVGAVLAVLYRWTPHVPWYGLMLVIGLWSVFATMGALLMQRWQARGLLVHLLVLGTAGWWLMLHLQFTILAILGMGLPIMGWDATTTWRQKILLGTMGVLGFLLRPSAAGIVGVLWVCRWIWHAWETHHLPTSELKVVPGVLVGMALLMGINQFHYDRDEGWRYYWQYNRLRAAIHDFRVDRYPELLHKLGWTPNDLALFRRHFYFHSIYSLAHLQSLHLSTQLIKKLSLNRLITYAVLLWTSPRFAPTMWWVFVWLVLMFLIGVGTQKDLYAAIATLAFWGGIILIVTVILKFPHKRSIFPLSVLMGWGWVIRKNSGRQVLLSVLSKWAQWLLLAVAIWMSYHIYNASVAYLRNGQIVERELRRLLSTAYTYFMTPDFPTPYLHPLQETDLWQRLRIIPLGGMIAMPWMDSLLAFHHIHDPYLALLRSDIRLLTADSMLPSLLSDFMEHHYRLCLRPSIESSLHFPQPWWKFQIWRFDLCATKKAPPHIREGACPK